MFLGFKGVLMHMNIVLRTILQITSFNKLHANTSLYRSTFTTFTRQATVCKNETARSDVIVPFGLHV